MKFNKSIFLVFALAMFVACDRDNIDPISPVDPGPDADAPVVTISYPLEGQSFQVPEAEIDIEVRFLATDDIELGSVKATMDGTDFASWTEFTDYRRLKVDNLMFEGLTSGQHVLEVTATDLEGKSTTSTVNFQKVSPYDPKYENEILYIPFDGNFTDLIGFKEITTFGDPGFAGETVLEMGDAYAGATDAYLTLDGGDFHSSEFSASFWLKVNAVPDRAGILVMGPPDEMNPSAPNNRKNGFRFFRENAGGMQRFKLNVGNGTADTWFDGGAAADVDPTTNEWVHFAFTISSTECVVYIDGNVVKQGDFTGVDWTGCDILSIMSGEPRFTGWNHKSDLSYMDELRIFDSAISQNDVLKIIADDKGGGTGYEPKFDGESFYLNFDGSYRDLVTGAFATEVGSPGFAGEAKGGSDAYLGAEDSYLTFSAADYQADEFSACFWYKVNAEPDRAGILVMGPPDPDNPDAQNKRTSGFRFFRENAGGMQRFKLNAGSGDAETWVDGGTMADIDPTVDEWIHMAFTISGSKAIVYFNGEVVVERDFGGISWAECDILSIMSGDPRFTGWNHHSDLSIMDELRLFTKALTQEEVKAVMDDAN